MRSSQRILIQTTDDVHCEACCIVAIAVDAHQKTYFKVEWVEQNVHIDERVYPDKFVCELGNKQVEEWTSMLRDWVVLSGVSAPICEWLTSKDISSTLPLKKSLVDWLETIGQLGLSDKLIEHRIISLSMLKFVDENMLCEYLNVKDARTRRYILNKIACVRNGETLESYMK